MTLALIASFVAFSSYGGLLVLLSRSGSRKDRVGRIFFLYLLDMLLVQASYLMVSVSQSKESALFWYTFNIPLSFAQAGIYFFFTRAFLKKDPPRMAAPVSAVIWVIFVVLFILFRPLLLPDIYRDPTTGLFVPKISTVAVWLSIPVLFVLGATIFELVREYKKSTSLQKVRIQYLLLAIIVVWVGMSANGSPTLRAYPIDVAANIASAFLIALAILRYQLLDINVVIRKGLVYSVSVVFMGIGYFTAIFLLTHLFVFERSNSLTLSIVAAIIVVGVLTPLRDRIQAWIDHALFRETYDGMAMIQRLSDTTASILDLDKLADTIISDVTRTMHIRWVVMCIKQGKVFSPLAAQGLKTRYQCRLDEDHPVLQIGTNKPGPVTIDTLRDMHTKGILSRSQLDEFTHAGIQMVIPLRARNGLVGLLVLGPKLSQQSYSPDDEKILATLANQVAVAADNARLYDALQHELTEREKLILQLKSKNAELESFTYTVSHDLKAPLITINGFLKFLEKDALSGNTERIRSDITRISEATERMHRLLTELLELSRIGRMMNEPEDVPFADLVKDALEIVQGQLSAKQVTVEVQPDLPTVRGDRRRLVEVLQNIIDNAVKYMGDQPSPLIEIGQDGEKDAKPVFFIRDNGMGIAPEYHERIFGLFNKLDPASEGTGIGLALVKKIIEVHRGDIWVESKESKGSTFYFSLPQK